MSDFIPYSRPYIDQDQMQEICNNEFSFMNERRTVRDFSNKMVKKEIIEKIVQIASTAPSGANKQPWTYCLVQNPDVKKEIRVAAEKEERENYESRMSEEWKEDIAHLGTDWNKPFLEIVPWLIVVFKKAYDINEDDSQSKNYYVNESVGLSCGFLLAAIHKAGLVALTHTPSPMNFLGKILNRPSNERPFLLIPVGYPDCDAKVPDISRKSVSEFIEYY